MRLEDMISNDTKEKLKQIRRRRRKNKSKPIDPEELAERQFKEMERMMGKHMDIYERKGGKVRRK